MKHFLIVKTSSIGDVIQSFHIVDYLHKRFPKCQVDWVVEKGIAPLLRAHPQIGRVLEIDSKVWRKNLLKYRKEVFSFSKLLKAQKYDAVFDLQGNTKSAIVTLLVRAYKKVGYTWKECPEKTNFFVTNVHIPVSETNVRERYRRLVQDFIGDDEPIESQPLQLTLTEQEEKRLERLEQLCFERPRLMICFGSNWQNKTLKEETLLEFLHLIDDKFSPSFFFIHGNEKEREFADRLEQSFSRCSHTVGELSLPLWQRFMQVVEGVITMDSASLHLCATTKTPSFSFFGPSSAEAYKPVGEKHYAFQGACPYDVQFEKRCPHLRTCQTGACLREQQAQLLFQRFETFWEKVSDKQLILC